MAKVKKVCEICKKEYEVYPSRAANSKTCSKQCRQIYAANSPSKKTGVYMTCIYCGKQYYRNKYAANRGGDHESKYCSKECKDKHHSEIHVGIDSNLYINGNYQGRGANWVAQRALARERDNNTCQICGITSKEHGKNMDVHPIKVYNPNKDYIEQNELSNLITSNKSQNKLHKYFAKNKIFKVNTEPRHYLKVM